MRSVELATDYYARFGAKQLNWRDRDRTLPNRCEDRIKVLPHRVAWVYPLLPFAARYYPPYFAGQIDTGPLAHSEPAYPIVDHIDAHLEPEPIEVPIARMNYR